LKILTTGVIIVASETLLWLLLWWRRSNKNYYWKSFYRVRATKLRGWTLLACEPTNQPSFFFPLLLQRSSLIKKESKTSISDSLINSPHSYEKELKVALECVHLAGEKLREALESDKLIHSKGRANDFVTETDRSNEELIFTKLRQHFPHHKFIGEVWPAFAPSLVTCSCLSLGNKCDIRSPRAHR
jgi:hypothetical protein